MADNLFKALITERLWVFEAFQQQFKRTAQLLADEEQDPRLRNLSVEYRTFMDWKAGNTKTRPHPDRCRVLERLFGYTAEELFGIAPASAPSSAEQSAAHNGSGLVLLDHSLTSASGGHALDLKGQLEMAAKRAKRFAELAGTSNVGVGTLENIQFGLRHLAAAYMQKPLATLLGDLIDVQGEVFGLLEDRQRPAQSRDLYLLAAMGTGMLAKASHDLGDPRSAMAQARAAAVCAENAGHEGMQAWIRGLQSLIAYWAGQHQTALKHARAGAPHANRTAGTVGIWLSSLEARACAVLGDVEGTQAAIRLAEEGWDHMLPDDLDEYGGIMSFTRPRQLYYAADALVWLPVEDADSEAAAEIALNAYENAPAAMRSFGDEAGTHTDLAVARIFRGELEGAVEALNPVLDLPVTQRNYGIRESVMHVHEALRARAYLGVAEANDLREQIEEFCQTPAVAAIPR